MGSTRRMTYRRGRRSYVKGLTIEVRDAQGNIVQRDWDQLPKLAPVDTTSTATKAERYGVTFHRQPCGSYVATAGSKRVCGVPSEERSKELVAQVMLTWLAWEK